VSKTECRFISQDRRAPFNARNGYARSRSASSCDRSSSTSDPHLDASITFNSFRRQAGLIWGRCTAGETNYKFACEDGAPVIKQYAGSDTGCTGAALLSIPGTDIMGTDCIPLFGTSDNAISYSIGCVGDIPKMIVHSSSDCSGDCVFATTEGMSTECTPSVRARSQAPFQSNKPPSHAP
jgi:hypothetical protein